jgi:outer membrane protein assembly factor BamA
VRRRELAFPLAIRPVQLRCTAPVAEKTSPRLRAALIRPVQLRCTAPVAEKTSPRLRAALIACVLWVGPRAARADVPPELAGRPVAEIEIEGGTAVLSDAGELGIERGTPLDRRVVRQAILRMLASGRWANVQIDAYPRGDEVVLRVLLEPRVVLTRIEVHGNSAIDDDALRQAMRVRERAEIEPGALPGLGEAARSAYAERGYARADVEVTLRDTDDPSRKVLIVRVEEGEPVRLRDIRFDGDEPPQGSATEHDGPLSPLGLGVGDVLDRRRLDPGVRAVQSRLRERGWLEARVGEPLFQPAEGGVVLVLPLRLGHHYRVEIRGERPLERGDVEGVLHLTDEPLTAPVVTNIRERVVDLFRRHGFHHVVVDVRRTLDPERPDDPRAAQLVVAIAPGRQLAVGGVSFPGATHFESGFLRDQINSYLEEDLPNPELFEPVDTDVVDRSLSGRQIAARREVPADVEVIPDRIWYEPTYAEAVQHIQEVYQAAGFLRARVGPAELRELEGDRAVVTIPVFEGPRTLVYDVRVRGNDDLGTTEILETAAIRRGDAFGHLPLEEARRRILDRYAERAHIFARVEPIVRFSPDRERAEIIFDVVERFAVTVGEIRVEGASDSDAGMIRDVILLRPGDAYRPSAARASEQRLLALGVFANVEVAPADPDLPERVKPIVVTVSERTTQGVGLSAGIGTGEGARGALDYTIRNLAGVGITLTLRIQLAYQFFFQDQELETAITQLAVIDRLERRWTLGIGVPWIPGLPNVRASLDLAHIRDNQRDFGYDKNGSVLSFSWSPDRRVSFALSGELEYNNVTLFGAGTLQQLIDEAIMRGDVTTQRLLRVPAGETAIGSSRVSVALDLRDSPFTPTQGLFAQVVGEYVHTLGAGTPPAGQSAFLSNFLRVNATVSGYVPIADGWVFAMQARGGVVAHLEGPSAEFPNGSETYPNRAYYLGGVDTLRGFLQDQVIPEDQARLVLADPSIPASAIVRTGDVYYLFRAELRFPIVSDFYGGVFADVGNVWARVESFDFLVPRWNAGLGVRIATPVGPIALDYGFNLDRRERLGEPFGSFHFSIGLF